MKVKTDIEVIACDVSPVAMFFQRVERFLTLSFFRERENPEIARLLTGENGVGEKAFE